jgi:protocatechuate 3,4-dioxygenase beta subunit
VSVLLLSGDAVLGATTSGDDGHYQIEGVPSGSYTLQFDPATSADPAVRAFDRATLAAFAVSAPAPRSGKDIILSRSTATVELAGQVVAADTGRPLNAVFVVFERLNPTTSAYEYAGLALSDTSGDYSGVLPPGTYRLAFRPGFSSDPDSARYLGEYFDDIAAGPTGATEITLAGGAIARADAALAPGGTIAGTVTGDDLPLAGAVTLISDAASGRLVAIALTDANGAYRSSGLPAGSYRLEFATYLADDPTTQTYAGTARAQPVALSSTASVTGIDARLSKGGTIAGTVTGTGGAPLANVLVLVLDTLGTPDSSDDELRGLALTNASGAYATSGMPTGSYVVSFSTALTGGPDVAAYFGEYSNDAATLADADPVSVVAGVQTANINANLRQGGQLRGRVTAAVGGFGLAGVLVEVYTVSDPTALVAFAITDERGDYATTALTTGSSYLVRFDPSFGGGLSLYTPEYYTDAASAAAAQAVSVPTTAPITGIDAELAALP